MAVVATPTTTQALKADKAEDANILAKFSGVFKKAPSKTEAKRTGKKLWGVAKVKVKSYHAVTHELQHRAQEKAAFGFAEAMLERIASYAVHAMEDAALVNSAAKTTKWWVVPFRSVQKGTGKVIASISKRLRPPKAATAHAAKGAHGAHAVAHHGAHHGAGHGAHHAPHPTGLVGTGLHLVHVALPILGTYLIAHMAHHDLHRAQHERKAVGTRALTTVLFYIGFLCDAFDAIAHFLVVCCLVLPENDYLNHHVEHQLHSYSLLAALVACTAMMTGEALSKNDPHSHGHGHGHGHGHKAKAH